MTAFRVGVAALSVAGLLAAGALLNGRDSTIAHPHPTATIDNADTGEITPAARTAITGVARRFAVAVSDRNPAGPAAPNFWAHSATAVLGRGLAAHPSIATPTETHASARLIDVSVAVRRGPTVTALVLGTLTVTAAGTPLVRTPVTWVLTLIDTVVGWRVAGVTP